MSVNSNFKASFKNKIIYVKQGNKPSNEIFERVVLTTSLSKLKDISLAGILIPAKPSVLLKNLPIYQYFRFNKKKNNILTYFNYPSSSEYEFERISDNFFPNLTLQMKNNTKFVNFAQSVSNLITGSYSISVKLEERTVFYIDTIETDLFPNLCNYNGSFSGFLILLNQYDINNIVNNEPVTITLDISWNEILDNNHYFDFKDNDGNLAQNQSWSMFQIKHGNYSRDPLSNLTLGDVIEVSNSYTSINPVSIDITSPIERHIRTINISDPGNPNV